MFIKQAKVGFLSVNKHRVNIIEDAGDHINNSQEYVHFTTNYSLTILAVPQTLIPVIPFFGRGRFHRRDHEVPCIHGGFRQGTLPPFYRIRCPRIGWWPCTRKRI